MNQNWWVYVLRSEVDNRTYVGVTTDVNRRFRQHNGELKGGAKSTRPFRPWILATVHGPMPNRSVAQQIEFSIKKLSHLDRLTFVYES